MRVAVLDDYQSAARDLGPWSKLGPDVSVDFFSDHVSDDDLVVERLLPYEVVVAMRERTPFPRHRLERLPNLKLLISTGIVNAAIDVQAARDLGVVVSGTGGVFSPTTELTWGLILALTRNICVEDRSLRDGGWQHTIGPELAGRTLGIVGLGRQGSRVSAIARAFDMEVIAWSQNLRPERAEELGVKAVTRQELFTRADVVTIHLILSDRSRRLIGADDIARMKPTAYFINTSRAQIIDEEALLAALRDRRIAGAAVDVYAVEPLPPDDPWRTAPNTVITPHIGYVATGTYEVYYRDAVENILSFREGDPVRVFA